MVIQESIGRDLLRLFVWYPLRWIILLIPVRWGIAVLRSMGNLHYIFARHRGGQKVLGNIARILGNKAGATDVLREYYKNHYIDRLLIFIFPKLTGSEIHRLIEIQGLEHLDRALQENKGVILVHGHFGPVHLPLAALALLGYQIKQIGLPSDDGLSWVGKKVAFRLRMHYEKKIPAEIIKADTYLRGVFRWLGNNGIIMITGDGTGTARRLGKQQVYRLFGRPVLFPLGPAQLSLTTGAPILPICIMPGRTGFLYTIQISKPLLAAETETDPAVDLSGQFVKFMEERIKQYPHYMHFLDRFCPGEMIVDSASSSDQQEKHD